MSFPKLPFLDVFSDVSRGNIKTLQTEFLDDGELPVVDQGQGLVAGFVNDRSRVCKAKLPVIVFGDHTRAIKYVDFEFAMGADGTKVLTPKIESDTKYLYYALVNMNIPAAGYSRHYKYLKETQVPVPPLADQKRIAGILDAADALRAKRREAIAQLDTFLQSTFLDMFGDPVANPMGWDIEDVDQWLDSIDSGWSPKCLDRKARMLEWGVLKLGAVTWCEFDESNQKALPPSLAPRPELEVAPGDLLFARKNTQDLVAAVAYVHNVRPRLMLSDLIFRLRLKSGVEVEPTYLWQLLIQPRQRKTIQRLAGGSAGSMPNISKAKLRTLKLIKPRLDLQRRFAAIADSVEQQKNRLRTHLNELDTLFASLQSRAFRGDL